MSWLKKLVNSFIGVFKSGAAEKAITAVAELVPKAIPIVEEIARWTPSRLDDELVALFKIKGLPHVEAYLALPQEQRGLALLQAATAMLSRIAPGASTSVLQTAVQVAYTGWKAEQTK